MSRSGWGVDTHAGKIVALVLVGVGVREGAMRVADGSGAGHTSMCAVGGSGAMFWGD